MTPRSLTHRVREVAPVAALVLVAAHQRHLRRVLTGDAAHEVRQDRLATEQTACTPREYCLKPASQRAHYVKDLTGNCNQHVKRSKRKTCSVNDLSASTARAPVSLTAFHKDMKYQP